MARTPSAETERSFREAAKQIKRAAKQVAQDTGAGLRIIGEEIMTDVKASRPGHGVPKDTGNLASTGMVDGPVPTPIGPTVELSFGGAAANYALAQHERTDYRHTVGESRYLVRGVERWSPGSSAAMDAIQRNAQAGLAAAGRGAGGTRQGRDARGRFTGRI
jgi:hypothetical protein